MIPVNRFRPRYLRLPLSERSSAQRLEPGERLVDPLEGAEAVSAVQTEADLAFVKLKDGLIAFASVVLDDQLHLVGIAVHRDLIGAGFRLTYPTCRLGETQFTDPAAELTRDRVIEKLKIIEQGRSWTRSC